MKRKWAVEIRETNLDQRNLKDLLGRIGFTLIDGIQFPEFTSPKFDECATVTEVYEIAKRVRTAFIGASQIDPLFKLGSVKDYSFSPPKSNIFLEVSAIEMQTEFYGAAITISPPKDLSAEGLKIWRKEQEEREYQAKLDKQSAKLVPSFRNPNAEKMLELLSIKNPSGEEIYKLYELAEVHPDNRKCFHKKYGILSDEFKRFKSAVHNPTVTGDWARHAYKELPKIPNPMSKDEAIAFVHHLAKKCLRDML